MLDDLIDVNILHQLYGLINVITQPQVPSHILTNTRLVTCVSVSGYLCDIYDLLTFYEKNFIFFNMSHILHRLDDLTDVI